MIKFDKFYNVGQTHIMWQVKPQIDGLAQGCSNSIAKALELPQCYTTGKLLRCSDAT